ncbi:MAG: SDR family oxidoreductase [Candidatus Latescibacterota bacterium]|nr:MAG: SDR family oxidoreductase [Candidatus Latescibacterota bacterium]
MKRSLVLITGATGYVGGRLIRTLDRSKYRIRCLARRPEYLRDRVDKGVEVMSGDVLDESSLVDPLTGVETAFYLVHSMGAAGDFAESDRLGARNFGRVAKRCGVKRIIYLGGLGETKQELSSHLKSRQEVGDILRESGVQVIEFQASIVIGSGSLSFELIRSLTERLPIMVTPRWVSVAAQPIAIEDLNEYLMRALEIDVSGDPIFQIGGSDVVSYGGLMREYARQRGLKRLMIPVPVLTPWLSSLWLMLFTPIYQRIGRRLVLSLRHPTTVADDGAREVFGIDTMGASAAIARALRNEDREFAETRWADALSSADTPRDWGGVRFGNRIVDSRSLRVGAPLGGVFRVIQRIGGQTGWYYANWLWRLRGAIDMWVGGVGLRRGRRHPNELRVGDVVDFWRVERIIPDKVLSLIAEMKLPGRAWLEYELSNDSHGTTIRQTAVFDPVGLFGLVYWYGLYPLHKLIFAGMLRNIGAACDVEDTRRVFRAGENS